MKKLLAIIFSAGLLMCLCNSCRVEGADKTAGTVGVKMFATWNNAYTSLEYDFMNVAFQFNAWLQNSADAPNARCMGYAVLPSGAENTWKLMADEQQAYLVETNGETLDGSAHWTITRCKGRMADCNLLSDHQPVFNVYGNYDRIENASLIQDNTQLDIQTIGTRKWKIQLITPGEWDDYGTVFADLTLTALTPDVPVMLSRNEYQLEGTGSFAFVQDRYSNTFNEPVYTLTYMGFQIEEPLEYAGDDKAFGAHFWKNGVLKMRATNKKNEETVRTARLTFRGDNYWVGFYKNENPEEGELWNRQEIY